jgi:hypothetical protein
MNRLRRRALGLADLLAERIPDRDELRETAPMGGTAAATLLAGLVLARAVHLGGWGKSARDEREEKVERASEAMRQAGRLTMEQLRARWSTTSAAAAAMPRSMPSRQVPAPALGVGGFIGVAAVGYLIWRLVRRGGSNHRGDSQPWYIGSPERQEHVPNQ